jgi:glyoxylase-like metal-dependent hydrolase (beta-lactamase superfamily II)
LRKMAEGVYQIEVPMRHNPLGYTYSYLLRDAATLIDTGVGTRDAFDGLEEQARSAGMELTDIKRIIPTHLHGDHIGLVDRVRRLSGAKVYAHRTVIERQKESQSRDVDLYADTRNETKLLGGSKYLDLLRRFESSFRGRMRSLDIDEPLEDGQILELEGSTLKVYWTPGHAREHICLHDEERRILYAGDHVLPKITPHVSLRSHLEGNPLGDYIESLERLRGLDVETVLPAHQHVFSDLDGRISEMHLHHKSRCDEMKKAIGDGRSTVFEISAQVSWDSRPWPEMEFWTKRMAARETLAHLVYLRERGELDEKVVKGVLYYSLT